MFNSGQLNVFHQLFIGNLNLLAIHRQNLRQLTANKLIRTTFNVTSLLYFVILYCDLPTLRKQTYKLFQATNILPIFQDPLIYQMLCSYVNLHHQQSQRVSNVHEFSYEFLHLTPQSVLQKSNFLRFKFHANAINGIQVNFSSFSE